jgi:peptidoglycan/LPS O-acetylase OafA/YrhL
LLVLSAMQPNIWGWLPGRLIIFLGDPQLIVKFIGVFGCGALFYLYRDRIRYDWRLAILAVCGLMVLLFSPRLAEAALSILGGYLLFWFAFNVKSPTLAAVGQKMDLSYGVYLYAWPVQKLIIWLDPGISPWLVFIEATAIAGIFASGSWWLVEKPFLNLKAAFIPVKRADMGSAIE